MHVGQGPAHGCNRGRRQVAAHRAHRRSAAVGGGRDHHGLPGRRPAAVPAQARRQADPGRGRRKRRVILARARGNLKGAFFVGPAFCYILLVVIYPLFYSLWASFTNMRLTSPLTSFVGLDTYAQALSSEIFQDSLGVTALFLASVVVLEFILGFALAYSFSRMTGTHPAMRALLLLPVMATPVSVGLIWKLMLNSDFGILAGGGILWLSDPQLRSEEHTSELQSLAYPVCRLLLEKKNSVH